MKEKFVSVYRKYRIVFLALLIVLLAFLPMVLKKAFLIRHACNILMYATLAGSLNIINGYSGQVCMGQAGFFAIGAYVNAVLSTRYGVNFWVLLPICGLSAALVGYLVSLPTRRLQGIYLSIVTMGAAEIIRVIALTWEPVTGGSNGIKGILYPVFFGEEIFKPKNYYYLFLVLAIIFLFVTDRVLKSRVGRAWISIREDQIAARSLGVETNKFKSLNFMYGAFWAGVVGCVYAPFVNYIDSSQFTLDRGFDVLAMVVIGGQGTLAGPIVGSAIVTILTETLRSLENWRYVIYACIIIAMMWWRPQGIAGASNSILAGGKIRRKEDTDKSKKIGGKVNV